MKEVALMIGAKGVLFAAFLVSTTIACVSSATAAAEEEVGRSGSRAATEERSYFLKKK